MISLYNTKSKQKEEFVPIHTGIVCMYHCGPTVYHYAHVGNLRAYVFADLLRRTFEYQNYQVKQVINITDVGHLTSDGDLGEDKLEKGAARENKSVWEIAKFYEHAFRTDLERLHIRTTGTLFPKATDYITQQINLIKTLEEKGFTYKISDGIYFDTAQFPRYADFAHLDVAGLQAGARVEKNDEKKNITDFALWKFSPTDHKREMEWDSPWGTGFPGWHIECSAMSMQLLGNHFDIHTGGIDHIPVHHTNEIAQSECATGETYANTWMHVNFLQITGDKMAKSGDNFIRLDTLIEKGIEPLSYRYWLLTGHYRKSLDFSIEAVEAAGRALQKLYKEFEGLGDMIGDVDQEYKTKFQDAINDDINTPQALAIVWEMMKDTAIHPHNKKATLLDFDQVLGLDLIAHKKLPATDIPDHVTRLAQEREIARAHKEWDHSDTLRKQIQEYGYDVLDTKDGFKLVLKDN